MLWRSISLATVTQLVDVSSVPYRPVKQCTAVVTVLSPPTVPAVAGVIASSTSV